jgi:hypothetical protein
MLGARFLVALNGFHKEVAFEFDSRPWRTVTSKSIPGSSACFSRLLGVQPRFGAHRGFYQVRAGDFLSWYKVAVVTAIYYWR